MSRGVANATATAQGLELQVERRRLDGRAGQSGEAVGDGIGDAEFHGNGQWSGLSGALHRFQSSPGMILRMNSSNNGTVNAVSPHPVAARAIDRFYVE